jgi:2-polyprenyl-3-methyl-5-hydroxy-6-metoxy-1,4-benzoquinol methylase
LKERTVDFEGKIIIDLGSGTGIFSRAMVNKGAFVTGVEPEISLIEQAVMKDKSLGLHIDYLHSSAEEMTFHSESCDIITALRSWHWFNRDLVNEQVMKVLKGGGYLVVIHSIFVPQDSEEAQATLRAINEVITDLKPAGSMGEVKERRTGLPINWFAEWKDIGLHIIDEWQYDYELDFGIDEWCGKVRSLSWLTKESEENKQFIIKKVKECLSNYIEPLRIPHRYSVVVLRKIVK